MTNQLDKTTILKRAANQARNNGFPDRHINSIMDGKSPNSHQNEAAKLLAPMVAANAIAIINGKYGCGKTWLAAWFATVWNLRGYSIERGKCRYYTMPDLLAAEKSTFGDKTKPQSPLELARECGLLVLDEIDATSSSDYDQREIRRLLDRRYWSEKPTILLTNLPDDRIGDALDASTLDRAAEGGGIIFLKGESMRGVGKTTSECRERKSDFS